MDKKIQQILEDIYLVDESLRENEEELIKIIEELLIVKPDTGFDEDFARQLRAEILRRAEIIKQARQTKFAPFANFGLFKKFAYVFGGAILILLFMLPVVYYYWQGTGVPIQLGGKIDDWKYDSRKGITDSLFGLGQNFKSSGPSGGWGYPGPSALPAPSALKENLNENLGFAVGGAKDINNFRKNIENNYLPLPTDITYEGLFYDYYFDTGKSKPCEELFCPSYSYAISADPFSGKNDYYLSVGLNSGIKESDFQRKKLNLVVVLDISGSMSAPFNKYYYDQFGGKDESRETDQDWQTSKIEIAAKSLVALLDHLNTDDQFGMVLFDDQAYLAKPLRLIEKTDMEKIKAHILEIKAKGGTQMSAGMKMGTALFDKFKDIDPAEYENRIIFLTDAMPNLGETNENSLLGMLKKNSENKIYTTFIGIGVDFNTELVEYITKVRGTNYYSVHSASEFKKRMDDEFEYMVTPLVFNLSLTLDAEGYKIEKVYGSPEANEATGEIMKVNTLFPSKSQAGETKGGIVLLKLKKISEDVNLKLKVNYENRMGKTATNETDVIIEDKKEFFENSGIRKAILLARYADLIKNWINDERKSLSEVVAPKPSVDKEIGIPVPPGAPQLGKWERQSLSLRVSTPYKELFSEFKSYFEKEVETIGDNTLQQEITILDKLIF